MPTYLSHLTAPCKRDANTPHSCPQERLVFITTRASTPPLFTSSPFTPPTNPGYTSHVASIMPSLGSHERHTLTPNAVHTHTCLSCALPTRPPALSHNNDSAHTRCDTRPLTCVFRMRKQMAAHLHPSRPLACAHLVTAHAPTAPPRACVMRRLKVVSVAVHLLESEHLQPTTRPQCQNTYTPPSTPVSH